MRCRCRPPASQLPRPSPGATRSRAYNIQFIADQLAKKCLRHLRPARVFGAKKEHSWFDRHTALFSYLQIWVILAGLMALLRVQHSA
jgi:hypothetical protein